MANANSSKSKARKNASAEESASITPDHIEALWQKFGSGKKLTDAEVSEVFLWGWRGLTRENQERLYVNLMGAGYDAEVARRARQGKGVAHG